MLRFPVIAAFFIGGLVGATIGTAFIASRVAHQGQVSEFKVLAKNLEADRQLTPQLREYLKARFYYVAMSLDRSETGNQKIDLGPIDATQLGQADPRSESVPYDQLYRDAVTKHTGAAPAGQR